MARSQRISASGFVYHVVNRAAKRATLFNIPNDYERFERALFQAREKYKVRLLAYCIMPNHWHLIIWPESDGELPRFMHWLTTTHVRRHHKAYDSNGLGPLYQGRYKSFLIENENYYWNACAYVEANPLRAKLVERAEWWQWSSARQRAGVAAHANNALDGGPTPFPDRWLEIVNSAANAPMPGSGTPIRSA
ncbi:MAG: transposase [Planctomycetota bacterium]